MSKFIILVVVASLVACISADNDDSFDDLGMAKAFDFFTPEKTVDNIKNLAKPFGGHVTGHAQTYSHKSETRNGVPVLDETKTDDVENDDGHVSEFKTDN